MINPERGPSRREFFWLSAALVGTAFLPEIPDWVKQLIGDERDLISQRIDWGEPAVGAWKVAISTPRMTKAIEKLEQNGIVEPRRALWGHGFETEEEVEGIFPLIDIAEVDTWYHKGEFMVTHGDPRTAVLTLDKVLEMAAEHNVVLKNDRKNNGGDEQLRRQIESSGLPGVVMMNKDFRRKEEVQRFVNVWGDVPNVFLLIGNAAAGNYKRNEIEWIAEATACCEAPVFMPVEYNGSFKSSYKPWLRQMVAEYDMGLNLWNRRRTSEVDCEWLKENVGSEVLVDVG